MKKTHYICKLLIYKSFIRKQFSDYIRYDFFRSQRIQFQTFAEGN